eukprot:3614062-Pyramimonas_sp.AAC.1
MSSKLSHSAWDFPYFVAESQALLKKSCSHCWSFTSGGTLGVALSDVLPLLHSGHGVLRHFWGRSGGPLPTVSVRKGTVPRLLRCTQT